MHMRAGRQTPTCRLHIDSFWVMDDSKSCLNQTFISPVAHLDCATECILRVCVWVWVCVWADSCAQMYAHACGEVCTFACL